MATEKDDLGLLGETHASKLLEIAFSGEAVKETMRGEGNGALDFQFRYKSSTLNNPQHIVGVQVKTGASFGRRDKKNRWGIYNIKPEHISKWKSSNQPVLLLWVSPDSNVYWKYFGSNTPARAISIPESHKINPSTKYEIDRLIRQSLHAKGGISKIAVPSFSNTSETRKWAKKKYGKVKGEFNSVLGNVTISNYAWRHLTRETRNKSHIRDSLLILPYVRNFLSGNPHQIQTLMYTEREIDDREIIVNRKVLAIFRDVRFEGGEKYAVYIRLNEKVIFRKNWKNDISIEKTKQSLILESIYRKRS